MNTPTALYSNQDKYGGSAACCVIACFLAKHQLRWGEKPELGQLDRIVREGSEAWQELQTGFMATDEVIAVFPELSMLKLRESYRAMASGEIRDNDGHLLAHNARQVILGWTRRHDNSVAVVTRSGYTYTILQYNSMYFVVDSHPNVLERHGSAIRPDKSLKIVKDRTSGLLLEYYFPLDVANYVVNFIEPTEIDERFLVSSDEMQIDILTLDEAET